MTTGLTHDGHKAASSRSEILPLTGLRAIAALWVVMHHIGVPESAPQWLVQIVQCGFAGVPLFFMLSGFVLAYNYPTLSLREPRKVIRFWMARIARVMPLYWAVLILAVLQRGVQEIPQDDGLWRHFVAIQTWSADPNFGSGIYNGPAWSICVELFLYAMFPVLVLIVAHVAKNFGTTGVVALCAVAFGIQIVVWAVFVAKGWADLLPADPQSAHRWLYRNPLPRIPDFTVGICLAFLVNRGVRFPTGLAHATQGAMLVLIPLLCVLRDVHSGPQAAAFFGVLWTVPFGLMILSLASDRGFFGWFLATRAMVSLGAASYALYLTHRARLPGLGSGAVESAPGYWAYVAVLLVLVWAVFIAEGAHRYIEVPCRKIVLNLYDKVARTPKHAAPTPDPATAGPTTGPAPAERPVG